MKGKTLAVNPLKDTKLGTHVVRLVERPNGRTPFVAEGNTWYFDTSDLGYGIAGLEQHYKLKAVWSSTKI